MQAAAHTDGGYGGVSQKVAKEYLGKDQIPRWLDAYLKSIEQVEISDEELAALLAPITTMASDSLLAFDYAMPGSEADVRLRGRDGLAFDFKSARTYTPEGHLHVAQSNISKANVSPYRGKEIPRWQDLGLDPEKVYQLFRDPKELEKGAASFNNKPLLDRHVAVTADDHDPELVMGNVSNVSYVHPYLKGDLGIWRRDGIDGVESKEKQQLSGAYRYKADMTPGSYLGAPYDGVMRDIVGNHVALVKDGRAGDDVVVGDSQLEQEPTTMTKKVLSRTGVAVQGALAVYLQPKFSKDEKVKLAMDAKPLDIAALLTSVSAKSYKKQIPTIVKGVEKATKGLLAEDASLEDLSAVLEALKPGDVTEGNDLDPSSGLPKVEEDKELDEDDVSKDDDPMAKVMQFLKGKIADEDLAKVAEMAKGDVAEDGSAEAIAHMREQAEKRAGGGGGKTKHDDKNGKFTHDSEEDDKVTKEEMKGAMDAALKKNTLETEDRVIKRMQGIAEAKSKVAPLVGELNMAFDSADGVFIHALKADKVDEDNLEGLNTKALGLLVDSRIALKAASSKGRRTVEGDGLAMDSKAAVTNFAKRYPGAAKIEVGA